MQRWDLLLPGPSAASLSRAQARLVAASHLCHGVRCKTNIEERKQETDIEIEIEIERERKVININCGWLLSLLACVKQSKKLKILNG